MDTVLSAIDDATDSTRLWAAAVSGVYDALLAGTGRTLSTLGEGVRLDPDAFAIPTVQWQAITAAALGRANAWGTGAQVAVDLANLLPATYDDPTAPVPQWDRPDRRPPTHQLHVSRQACDVIAAATAHVRALARCYGTGSPRHLAAADSWLSALSMLFGLGLGAMTQVAADGELGLLVTTQSAVVYALVFEAQARCCVAGDGCTAVIADDATAHPPAAGAPVAQHRHEPSYPLGAPRPGRWSAHS
jgi:hypothetical protein